MPEPGQPSQEQSRPMRLAQPNLRLLLRRQFRRGPHRAIRIRIRARTPGSRLLRIAAKRQLRDAQRIRRRRTLVRHAFAPRRIVREPIQRLRDPCVGRDAPPSRKSRRGCRGHRRRILRRSRQQIRHRLLGRRFRWRRDRRRCVPRWCRGERRRGRPRRRGIDGSGWGIDRGDIARRRRSVHRSRGRINRSRGRVGIARSRAAQRIARRAGVSPTTAHLTWKRHYPVPPLRGPTGPRGPP